MSLMVDDLDAQHQALSSAGYEPTPIKTGAIHNAFSLEKQNLFSTII